MEPMGIQAYTEMKKETPVSLNQKLTAAVVDVGQRIAKATGKDYKWDFTLFESKEVNAWCLPGGKVGVYTGIVPVAKTNAGLAAVLGHESGHAVANHGGERMSEQLVVTGAEITAQELLGGNSAKRQLSLAAIGLGAQVGFLLPFSRTQESEADEMGLTFMAKAGYDPREAISLWQRMATLGGEPPALLSDHPASADREAALKRLLPKAMEIWNQSQKVATFPL